MNSSPGIESVSTINRDFLIVYFESGKRIILTASQLIALPSDSDAEELVAQFEEQTHELGDNTTSRTAD